jgi:hypothetical protein
MGANQQLMLAETAGVSVIYATFDPANTGSNLALSGGNLAVTDSTGGTQFTRSTISKNSGKWYWEITTTTLSAGDDALIGIVLGAANKNTEFVGQTTNGWAYQQDGQKITNNSPTAYGSTFNSNGIVIGVYLDAGAGSIGFKRNNVDQGTAFTGLTGPFYAAVTPLKVSANVVLTANFGATALTYTPPAGYNAGLYQ